MTKRAGKGADAAPDKAKHRAVRQPPDPASILWRAEELDGIERALRSVKHFLRTIPTMDAAGRRSAFLKENWRAPFRELLAFALELDEEITTRTIWNPVREEETRVFAPLWTGPIEDSWQDMGARWNNPTAGIALNFEFAFTALAKKAGPETEIALVKARANLDAALGVIEWRLREERARSAGKRFSGGHAPEAFQVAQVEVRVSGGGEEARYGLHLDGSDTPSHTWKGTKDRWELAMLTLRRAKQRARTIVTLAEVTSSPHIYTAVSTARTAMHKLATEILPQVFELSRESNPRRIVKGIKVRDGVTVTKVPRSSAR